MKTALLTRTRTGDTGTFGRLEIMGQTFATAELPERNNEPCRSCIPAGVYECRWIFSPHFNSMRYEIMDVPNRSHVLLHVGNHAGDTRLGFKTDSDGCVLVGEDHADIEGQPGVCRSKDAMMAFERLTAPEDIQIAIVEEYSETGEPDGKTTVTG